ncbi:hypothetical protein BW685_25530 [Burkholderia ubonensis]|uniref:Uncharacterized protein n=1 Tax=Burkholderia ubonensis TaxID=101571 RepID=A0A1R1J4W0_9BURK|nr:hypothetical protein BW685_25530 [Burkholderia ubonensis]
MRKLNFTTIPIEAFIEAFDPFRQFGRNYLYHILASLIFLAPIEYDPEAHINFHAKFRHKKPLWQQAGKSDHMNSKITTLLDFNCND